MGKESSLERGALQRFRAGENENSLNTGERLRKLAIRLGREGKSAECFQALELSREDVLKAGVDEEKPRELCAIARCFLENGKATRSREVLDEALALLDKIKDENPWKYTNYTICAAHEMSQFDGGRAAARELLHTAYSSLPAIDKQYGKRKSEILSYLKGFAQEAPLNECLCFSIHEEMFRGVEADNPHGQSIDSLFLHIFLTERKTNDIKALAERRAGLDKVLKEVSGIGERWREAVAFAILARLFLEGGNSERSRALFARALTAAKQVRFYWVRDEALLAIAGCHLEAYRRTKAVRHMTRAVRITDLLKDPWKKARSLCAIGQVYTDEGNHREASVAVNRVFSQLLEKIDYRHRTAMSMLLMSEAHMELGERDKHGRRGHLLHFLNPDRRKAEHLRRRAHLLLDACTPQERKEALDEYEEFISLKRG